MYRQTSTIEKSRLMMRFLFSSSTSRQHSFENYLIRAFILIFCRIAFHRCSQISATKSHDTLHKTFFFFLEKIDNFVRVEKFRLIKYDVAIIIYVVFLWISNSKDIDEIIFYQIFYESSRFHFLISFECICLFEKWKRFAIKHFEMSNLISNWFFQQFLHENQWWISTQCWRRRLIQYVRSDEITFWVKIFRQFRMLFDAFRFFD
jgi:hypothetical protein